MNEPQTTLYCNFDAGAVAALDGFVYRKVGVSYQLAGRSRKSEDVINVKEFEFKNDDKNVERGDFHRTWSKIEMALSNLPQFTSLVWNDPLAGVNTLSPTILTYGMNFTCQAAGIVRLMLFKSASYATYHNITINGLSTTVQIPVNPTMKDAIAIQVMKGDVITAPAMYARAILLPFSYKAIDEE